MSVVACGVIVGVVVTDNKASASHYGEDSEAETSLCPQVLIVNISLAIRHYCFKQYFILIINQCLHLNMAYSAQALSTALLMLGTHLCSWVDWGNME